ARAGINVVACGLNAEVAEGGTADLMARRLELAGATPIVPAHDVYLAKVVVFVPDEALEGVFSAMSGAGAGAMGEYTRAGFRGRGTGTFLPGERAVPYSGQVGRLNFVDETRLEMICPSFKVGGVVQAMLKQHPYEEVAFDVYRTESAVPWGRGRIGDLARGMKLSRLLEDLAGWCASANTFLDGDPDSDVTRVAVAPGAGDELLEPAGRGGAEVFVTGELSRHARMEAHEDGIAVVGLGNPDSRRALVPALVETISRASDEGGWNIEVHGYKDRRGRWG
ncbi:MAG: Nif3-like dinuclear metal center hexameric protein, partial [Candidatus Geothermincolia bacterium]